MHRVSKRMQQDECRVWMPLKATFSVYKTWYTFLVAGTPATRITNHHHIQASNQPSHTIVFVCEQEVCEPRVTWQVNGRITACNACYNNAPVEHHRTARRSLRRVQSLGGPYPRYASHINNTKLGAFGHNHGLFRDGHTLKTGRFCRAPNFFK